MMRIQNITVAKLVCASFMLAIAWTVIATQIFLSGTGLRYVFAYPFYQWWSYLIFATPNPTVSVWLKISAILASIILAIFVIALCMGRRRLGPSLKPSLFGTRQAPIRGSSDNHGHADWLSMPKAREMFPGPSPVYGGVVIGEAYRVDQDRASGKIFNPHNKATWGNGGKAPLLIDNCEGSGPTHSLVFAGPGSFKSTAAVSTLLTWTGSAVVLDPSTELGPMVASAREEMGHSVFQLNLHEGNGINVLDWIDIASPLATTDVLSVVSWIAGEGATGVSGGDKGSREFFDSRGRALIACLLCHMLWDPKLPPEIKTLRTLRAGLSVPEDEMRKVLEGIHKNSVSSLARDFAGTLKGLVDETFSGVFSNADEHSSWLSNPAFASIVSESTFRTSDLLSGKTSVFVQIPLKALMTTPAVGRVLIGALLNSAYEADGKFPGRILYLLDEAARLGPMKIIEAARDAGRKYGITLRMLYQSVGQLEKQWGRDGKREWYDGCAHRSYASVQDPATAKELEEIFGSYAVMATSEGSNSGASGKSFEVGSRSKGANTNYHEISRPLIRSSELMNDCRSDEVFVVVRDGKPLRCGQAIFFRRPEFVAKVDENRFTRKVSEEATAKSL